MSYKTHQREEIENLLKEKKDYSMSVSEIMTSLTNKISKATVYRTLEMLTSERILKKFYNELTSNYEYQYCFSGEECIHHLHMKCSNCGKLIHLSCQSADMFLSHISRKHGFCIDQGMTMIYGICSSCSLVKEGK